MQSPIGYCPKCGEPGMIRERRPNGNDQCPNGHSYPSKEARPSTSIAAPLGYCPQCGARGVKRSKPHAGDDWCENHHSYPSDHAIPQQEYGEVKLQVLTQGLRNIQLYAARHRDEEWAKEILKFCRQSGIGPVTLRE
jgi:hypothetical protein